MQFFVTLFFMLICGMATIQAQTFTEHIQKKQNGQGSVTIYQSKQIENLVNGTTSGTKQTTSQAKNKPAETSHAAQNDSIKKTPKTDKKSVVPDSIKKETVRESKPDSAKTERNEAPKKENERGEIAKRTESTEQKSLEEAGMEIPTVDMRKKRMTRNFKKNCFRRLERS